ncbi:type II toxin-antitoxin system VapC family toxin [uncultured Brevundimonas sp.]|uniref:type II toxin-antitoxin system VapC family toxin n=1 Tax=uncultured Brevundimonas sp. TaxID=213418 RepID=UPI0026215219|nr:type II toxin-antitoxin system VapC family toxin [uncultured Brevundimonas sp.]
MTFLIDTNIISELSKRPPDPAVLSWLKGVRPDETFLSVAVVAELRAGIEQNAVNRFGVDLQDWLVVYVLPNFEGRILGVDERVADLWGRFVFRLRRLGAKEPVMDALIAATGAIHGMTIVTRNTKHFAPLDVAVLNPADTRP